jgi:hypothetical protein
MNLTSISRRWMKTGVTTKEKNSISFILHTTYY